MRRKFLLSLLLPCALGGICGCQANPASFPDSSASPKASSASDSTFASIFFGTEGYAGTERVRGNYCQATGVEIETTAFSRVCYGAPGYALSMGSESENGVFAIRFAKNISLRSVQLLAYRATESPCRVEVAFQNGFGESAIRCQSKEEAESHIGAYDSSYWNYYSGFQGESDSLTITAKGACHLCALFLELGPKDAGFVFSD